jgi:hypothetical protein
MTTQPVTVSSATRLEVSKAMAQVEFIDRAYSLNIWASREVARQWAHDLELMRHFNDMRGITLELTDSGSCVLFAFRIEFDQQSGGRLLDSGTGVELPMLDRGRVRGHRLIVQHKGGMERYRHLLAMKWGDAPTLDRTSGSSYESEHARKITGGRQSGSFFVGNDERRLVVVTQAGNLDYVFAKSMGRPEVQNVFIHRKWVAPGVDLKPGTRLSALLVVTPRGVQARDVRAA